MNKPILYIFSGLPGAGKTTLAKELAKVKACCYLRIDTVEQGLRDLCDIEVEGEGYRLTYLLATENLKLGLSVISDSCNPIELTRNEWNQVAKNSGVEFINIEVVCSDMTEHRNRVESRKTTVKNLKLPTWEQVINREYDPWTENRIVLDTSGKSVSDSTKELLSKINSKS